MSHPMFSLSPPLFFLRVGTSCDLVFRGLWGMCRYGARDRAREREREEETSVSPYIKTSTHHTTLYEGLRCWVSHPMFALIPPLFPPLVGTSCDLVFRGLWGMCRYGAVSFLDMLCRDCFVQIDLRLGSTLTYPQHYRFCL